MVGVVSVVFSFLPLNISSSSFSFSLPLLPPLQASVLRSSSSSWGINVCQEERFSSFVYFQNNEEEKEDKVAISCGNSSGTRRHQALLLDHDQREIIISPRYSDIVLCRSLAFGDSSVIIMMITRSHHYPLPFRCEESVVLKQPLIFDLHLLSDWNWRLSEFNSSAPDNRNASFSVSAVWPRILFQYAACPGPFRK